MIPSLLYRVLTMLIMVSNLTVLFPSLGAAQPQSAAAVQQPASAAHLRAATPPQPALPAAAAPEQSRGPERPALSIDIAGVPAALAAGDTLTLTLTLSNRAQRAAASAVVLSLPAPAAAQPLPGAGLLDAASGWRWPVGALAPGASTSVTARLRITADAKQSALLLQPQVSAAELSAPVRASGGAALVARAVVTQTFTPGAATTLRSADGLAAAALPPGLLPRGLTLRAARTPLPGAPTPPETVQGRRSFGTLFLDAQDSQGQAVHQFTQPLTLTFSYTPEQIQAAGVPEADLAIFWFDPAAQRWTPLPSRVDAASRSVMAQVDHFSAFALGDGSSPSAAYIPSLQGFQTSLLTGAASYSYNMEVPAGPGGLKPNLSLSYSSAASDGPGGTRGKWQAGWVGKGWSFDPAGYVARNKSRAGEAWDTFTMVFAGHSYDLVKERMTGVATNGHTCTDSSTEGTYPECWTWRPVNDDFTRVSAVVLPSSSTPIWRAWTKDGTRYDFGINNTVLWGDPDTTAYDSQRWLLVKITDVHGNKIVFNYQIDTVQTRFQPTYALLSIAWAYDGALAYDDLGAPYRTGTPRYQVWFNDQQAVSRQSGYTAGVDTEWEYPPDGNPGYWRDLTSHEQYRLDTVKVVSCPSTPCGYQLVRQYNLTYADAAGSLRTDELSGQGQRVLTLLSVEQLNNSGQAVASPNPLKLSFSYGTSTTGTNVPTPNWNRLSTVTTGQGGRVAFSYENVWTPSTTPSGDNYGAYYINYRRVSQVLEEDLTGTGAKVLTTYSYGTPHLNDYSSAATVVYAQYPASGNGDSRIYLIHAEKKEFRGHEQVTVRTYDGGGSAAPLLKDERHWFYTGFASCLPALATVNGKTVVNESDACYQELVRQESLKGKELQTEVWDADGSAPLQRTTHAFTRVDLPYWGDPATAVSSNNFKRTGLWRVFTYEHQTVVTTLEGSGTARARTTNFSYETSYGTQTRQEERDETGALVRATTRQYIRANTPASYIVDRVCQEDVRDGGSALLSLSATFYDGATSACAAIGARGLATRTTRYYDIPAGATSTVGLTLHGTDSTSQYDTYGNRTVASTYTAASTRTNDGTSIGYSAPQGSARSSSTTYDSVYHMLPVSASNALGHQETAAYDERMGTLIKVVGPNSSGGTTTDCTQASFSIPLNEETTCAQYDSLGRLVRIVKAGDSTSAPTTAAYYFDAEQPFRYLVTHAVTDTTGDPQSETLQFYDGMGRKIQVKQESVGYGAQQIVTDTRYDGLGRVVAQSQPRYDATLNAYWNYLAPGAALYRATRTSYDALGRTRDVSAPDGATSSTAYAPALLDAALDANGHRTEQIHDSLGRLTKVRESDSTALVYEAEGGSLSHLIGSAQGGTWLSPATSGTRSQSNFLTYGPYVVPPVAGPGQIARFRLAIDSLNAGNDAVAQIQVNDADAGNVVAQRTLYRYDFQGGLDQWREFSLSFDTTSLVGHHLEYRVLWLDTARMAHDRTVVSWSQTLLSTLYRYDGRDLLTGVTDANGNTTSMSYDSAGRKLQMADPDMGAWSYTYDVNSNLTSQTDARTTTTSFGYDALDRLTSQSFSDGTPAYYLGYDDASAQGIGHQTALCSATPSAACGLWQDWRYDGRGRTIRQSQGFDGTWHALQYTYDRADRISTIQYSPTDEIVTYRYDAAGRPVSLCSSIANQPCYISNATATAMSQPAQWTYGNGVVQGWTYSAAQARLSNIQIGLGQSGGVVDTNSLFDRGYGYDDVGNLLWLDNYRLGQRQSYSYDARDRLTRWWITGVVDESYGYDLIGNLSSKAGVSYSYGSGGNATGAGPHQARSVGGQVYSYDANGNLLSGGGRALTWNAQNQPRSITGSDNITEQYRYDINGARVQRLRGSVSTLYFQGLWEETPGMQQLKLYTFNGKTVAQREVNTNTVTYLHGDHLGGISLTTSSSKTLLSQQEFDAWGKRRSGGVSQTTFNYTGQRLDDTGLLYYNARYYDPHLGRFLSADSIAPNDASGGTNGLALKPLTVDFHELKFLEQLNQESRGSDKKLSKIGPANTAALNRYSYVENNPVRYTDPSGHCGTTGFLETAKSVMTFDCTSRAYHALMNSKTNEQRAVSVAVLGMSAIGATAGWAGTTLLAYATGSALAAGASRLATSVSVGVRMGGPSGAAGLAKAMQMARSWMNEENIQQSLSDLREIGPKASARLMSLNLKNLELYSAQIKEYRFGEIPPRLVHGLTEALENAEAYRRYLEGRGR